MEPTSNDTSAAQVGAARIEIANQIAAIASDPTPPAPAPPAAHHAHFLNLGQIIGLALLGLQAYSAQDAPDSGGPSIFLNPKTVTPYLQGVLSLFPPAPPVE